MTEFVFSLIKPFKLEFLLKTCLHAVEAVEVAAAEAILLLPGATSREPVSSQDGFTIPHNTVCLTLLPHVITTQPENINLADPLNLPPIVKKLVLVEILITPKTSGLLHQFTPSHPLFLRFKLKL